MSSVATEPTVTLSVKTLNKILDYLADQKWKETNNLIVAVHAEVEGQQTRNEPDQAAGEAE